MSLALNTRYTWPELKEAALIPQLAKNNDLPPADALAASEPSRRLLDISEVSVMLGVSRTRAYELARRQVFPSLRLGRQVRVDRVALEQWLLSGRTADDRLRR